MVSIQIWIFHVADVFLARDGAINDGCTVVLKAVTVCCCKSTVVHGNTFVLCSSSLIWFSIFCMDLDFTGVKLNLFNITLKDWLFDIMGN